MPRECGELADMYAQRVAWEEILRTLHPGVQGIKLTDSYVSMWYYAVVTQYLTAYQGSGL